MNRRLSKCDSGQITMEKTGLYFVLSNKVPSRVYQMNSSVRLLVTLRDPVKRAISHYLEVLSQVVLCPICLIDLNPRPYGR